MTELPVELLSSEGWEMRAVGHAFGYIFGLLFTPREKIAVPIIRGGL